MSDVQVAIYARVSSEQQASDHTIASQLAALRERVESDGFALLADHLFTDEGYSGATLLRPALDHLRDMVAAGGVDRLYVHSPDRLARKYAYQVLLVDEFQRAGVEVIFLNRELGRSPEDDLLLQVQGMVAEYERAKILERSRRGKRHAAQMGQVSVLSGAPYGYRYVPKQEGGGQARFEVVLDEARVVRQVFDWVGRERRSIGEVCRCLQQAGEHTRTGKTVWDRSTVAGLLHNPAYTGAAAFGKTRQGEPQPLVRTQRGRPVHPRHPKSVADVAPEAWISVPVPPLVSQELFDAVHEQVQENRLRAREGQRGARYLLQGLVTCATCGYAYYGKAISTSAAKGHPRAYAYYRCIGTDAYRFGGQRVCMNRQLRTDVLDAAVWHEVRALLAQPERLTHEYARRLHDQATQPQHDELTTVEAQLRKLRQGIGRLIDSYAEGLLDKQDFEPRIKGLKERVAKLEGQAKELSDAAALQSELRLIVGRLEDFATTVTTQLGCLDWASQRAIIRTLVQRVDIDHNDVTVVFRIHPEPITLSPDATVLQHCGGRDHSPLRGSRRGGVQIPIFHVSRFEPLTNQFLSGNGANGAQQERVVDVVKRPTNWLPHSRTRPGKRQLRSR